MKKNIILDASILSSLMSCPRLTDFKYNENFTSISGKSNSLEVGSIVHKFLEYYYKTIIKSGNKIEARINGHKAAELYIAGCASCAGFKSFTCNQCDGKGTYEAQSTSDNMIIDIRPCLNCENGQIIKPECGHQPDEFPGVKNTPSESEKRNGGMIIGWKYALDTCHQYLDFWKNDHWVPLETEVVKGEILYENDDIRILWKAKLDLIVDTNQDILPVDHKTMKQRRDKITLNNQFTGQCLVMKTRKVVVNKIGFQTSLKPEEKFTREIMNYSADRLIEWQSEILPYYAYKFLDYSEQGHWPANFTHCENNYGKCEFIPVCEADRGMRGEELRLHFMIGRKWDPTND